MSQTQHREAAKDITTGIIVTTIMFAAALYLPVVGFFIALLIPLPVLFCRSKLGRAYGVLIPVTATIIILAISGRISIDTLFLAELLMLGFALSEFLEQNLSIEKTVLFTCCIVLLSIIGLLFFYSNLSGTDIMTMVSEYVSKNLEHSMKLYDNMNISEENLYIISNALEKILYIIIRIIPAMVIASTLFITWINLLLAKPILKSKNLFYPDFGPLKLWKAPEYLVWGVIGCGVMLLLPASAIKVLGLNGLLVLMTIYFFEGIAVVSFYFEKKGFSKPLRIFLYSLIALQQMVLLIIIGLGFFDVWLNFRKLEINNNENI